MLFTHCLSHSETHQFMKGGLCIRSEKRIVRTQITGVCAENSHNTGGKYVANFLQEQCWSISISNLMFSCSMYCHGKMCIP